MPRRFYIAPETIKSNTVILDGPEAHHILHVLRLKKGAGIELFDGTGNLYAVEISNTSRDNLSLIIRNATRVLPSKPELHLAPALLKGKKLELVLQKAVELGVVGLHPFYSQYGDKPVNKTDSSEDRWQRIILEACKQCGQALLPRLSSPVSWPALLSNTSSYSRVLLCYEKETTRKISDFLFTPEHDETILMITGPEGGFSEREISSAMEHNCIPVSLGSLTLRAETAAIAAVAIVQHLLGHLG